MIFADIRRHGAEIIEKVIKNNEELEFYVSVNTGCEVKLKVRKYMSRIFFESEERGVPYISVYIPRISDVDSLVHEAMLDFATSIDFLLTELGGEELLHKFVDEEWKRLTA